MAEPGLTIAKLANHAAVGVETVRYYERRGLIAQPARRDGAIRRYGPEHVKRIQFIRRAQELGFTLDEVSSLLELEDATNRSEIQRVASARLEQIRSRLADLRRMEKTLTRLLKDCEEGKTHACPIIETIGSTAPWSGRK